MNNIYRALVPLLFALPVMAQPGTYDGKTWTGLLVADSCNVKPSTMASQEADITTASRTTTPAVDQSGTRGSSTALDPQANPISDSKRSVPFTGAVDSKLPKGLKDPGWDAARKQAGKLAPICRIHTSTKRFLLVKADGSALALDDVANAGAQQQLPGLTSAGNIFRVVLSGTLQNGKISLSTIRF